MDTAFRKYVQFLSDHKDVYNFQLTKIFIQKCIPRVPLQWVQFLANLNNDELNEVPFTDDLDSWPESLQKLVITANELSINRESFTTTPTENKPLARSNNKITVSLSQCERRGMNPKKCHEVEQLASLVQNSCDRSHCQHIIDVGSGLGYLGQVLNNQFGYYVCGLESEHCRTHSAEAWIKKKDVDGSKIDTVTFTLTDNDKCYADFNDLILSLMQQKHEMGHLFDVNSEHLPTGEKLNSLHVHGEMTKSEKSEDKSNEQGNNPCEENIDPLPRYTVNENCIQSHQTRLSQASQCCNCVGSVVKTCSGNNHTDDSNVFKNEKFPSQQEQLPTNNCVCIEIEKRTLDCDKAFKVIPKAFSGVCMTGLHCCGDLTPTMLKFFLRCPKIKSLVCLGCCYHNMSQKEGESEFNMFPLSAGLKQACSEMGREKNPITKFALRLAAQETRTRWRNQNTEDHQFHTNNVAFRGLLEYFCHEENIPFMKEKRKVARKKDYKDLDAYITAVIERSNLDKPAEYIRGRMHRLYKIFEEDIKLIEATTCLQVILQPVIESLIIKDRLAYLHEHNIKAEVVPVFDENISPRNLAIVAWKS